MRYIALYSKCNCLIDEPRFVLQLISLAGLHSNAAATGTFLILMPYRLLDIRPAELAARFKDDGMLAYVELVQRKEKEIGCDVLTHQKWFVSFSKFCFQCFVNFYDTGAVPTTLIR